MTRTAACILLVVLTKVVNGQSISTQMSARAAGMGFASSTLIDEWSLFNNPGSLGSQSSMSASAAYEVRSRLQNANRMAFAFTAPVNYGALAIGAFRFGDNLYNEHMISAGFGNKFGIATLGLKTNYIQYRAEGFQTYGTLSLDLGGLVEFTDQLSVGAYITNLTQSRLKTEGTTENLPTRLTTGITYKPNPTFVITTELDKDIDYKPTWRTGIEYAHQEKIFARTGFSVNPNSGYFGFGAKRKRLQTDYAVILNTMIGASHHVSVTYRIVKAENK